MSPNAITAILSRQLVLPRSLRWVLCLVFLYYALLGWQSYLTIPDSIIATPLRTRLNYLGSGLPRIVEDNSTSFEAFLDQRFPRNADPSQLQLWLTLSSGDWIAKGTTSLADFLTSLNARSGERTRRELVVLCSDLNCLRLCARRKDWYCVRTLLVCLYSFTYRLCPISMEDSPSTDQK